MGRGKVKKCASKWHKEWKSSSVSLINFKIPLVIETFLAKLLTCGKQQNINVFVQTVYRYA